MERLKKNLYKNIILALSGTLGIMIEMADSAQNANLAGDILWIPIFGFMYYLYSKVEKSIPDKKRKMMVLLYSAFLAFSLTLGIALDQDAGLTTWVIIVKSVILTVSLYPMVEFVTCWLDKPHKVRDVIVGQDKKVFMVSYGIVVLLWLMTYMASFPGIYGIDAPTWYNMWRPGSRNVSSQWSVVISGVFYGLVHIGEKMGNPNIGFAMYTMLQMICILAVIWKIMKFMQKEVSNAATIITALFFALVPTHAILAITSAQDGLFAACFAMCSMYIVEFSKNKEFYCNKRNIVKLIFWLILLCVIRNNGLYAIVVMAVLAWLIKKKNKQIRKYLYSSLGIVVLVVMLYQGPVYGLLHVQKGTAVREMLSIPLQQMASVYNYAPLDDGLKKEIEKYVPEKNLKEYIPGISDAVKNYLRVSKVKENPTDFLKLYVKVCSKYPKYALTGILKQTYGLWHLNKRYPDDHLWHPYINYKNTDARINWGSDSLNITQTSILPWYNKLLSYLFADGDDASGYGGGLQTHFQQIPGLAMLCKLGTYFWIVVYIAMYGVYKGWKEKNLLVYFNLGLTCTVFLSPLMCYRYYAPVIFSIPVIVSLLFNGKER